MHYIPDTIRLELNMHNSDLDLSFKGSRSYIHGTDLYLNANKMLSSIEEGYIEKLSLKRATRNACTLNLEAPTQSTIATGTFVNLEAGERTYFNIDETGQPALGRYAFNEAEICNNVFIDGNTATLSPVTSGHTMIEAIVATTKVLHTQNLPPPTPNQWLFGQLELKMALPDHAETIAIEMTKLVKKRFSINHIYINSRNIGEIRFIAGTV